jgi:hypothetical protein
LENQQIVTQWIKISESSNVSIGKSTICNAMDKKSESLNISIGKNSKKLIRRRRVCFPDFQTIE